MASLRRRRPENALGDFYVDETCIDCDTCRWMAPETYDRSGEQSRVAVQPRTAPERRRALEALVACPTASIGTMSKPARGELEAVIASFPLPVVGDEVLHCGFHARSSFGAASYLLRRDGGNVLVDSPRWSPRLAESIERLGGARWLFLTHRDDVADHERWRERLGCERVLHEADARSVELRGIERLLVGEEPVALAPDLLAIPVPGHTRGSACLLWRDVLFTGDHLCWSEEAGRLHAFRDACWFDWGVQRRSMERLARHEFTHVLPGHGRRVRLAPGSSGEALAELVAWMEQRA